MIKLDPMATVPDTARARPTYLSSTMKNYAGGEGERSGQDACPWRDTGNECGRAVLAARQNNNIFNNSHGSSNLILLNVE